MTLSYFLAQNLYFLFLNRDLLHLKLYFSIIFYWPSLLLMLSSLFLWTKPQNWRNIFLKPEYRKAFQPSKAGIRKVILATNIAETGITLSDVIYVIDAGILSKYVFIYSSKLKNINCYFRKSEGDDIWRTDKLFPVAE